MTINPNLNDSFIQPIQANTMKTQAGMIMQLKQKAMASIEAECQVNSRKKQKCLYDL